MIKTLQALYILLESFRTFRQDYDTMNEVGERMLDVDCDGLATGGFWIWDYRTNEVYYSPKFCVTLGFNYGDFGNSFDGFNLANKDMFDKGVNDIQKLISIKSNAIFMNEVLFTTKRLVDMHITCVGTVVYDDDEPTFVLGTHKIN